MRGQMKDGQRRRRCLLELGMALMLLFFVGCGSVEVVRVNRADTIWVESVRIDSVKWMDSVIVNTYAKGDTIFKDRMKVVYRDRVRILTDTVVEFQTVVKEVYVPSERRPSVWEQIGDLLKELKWVMVVAFGGWIVWKVFKR